MLSPFVSEETGGAVTHKLQVISPCRAEIPTHLLKVYALICCVLHHMPTGAHTHARTLPDPAVHSAVRSVET